MLNLKNVSLRVGSKLLFEDATFQLHAGQRLGLIGANGCGKTSLFRLLLGDLELDLGEVVRDPRLEIAHVSQQSPAGRRSAVDFVLDGDRVTWPWVGTHAGDRPDVAGIPRVSRSS